MSAPTKIKFLTETFLQKHSEFQAGLIIGGMNIPPEYQARSVWETYKGDLLMVHGKLVKYIIERSGDNLLIVYIGHEQKYDTTSREAANASIMVYHPVDSAGE